MIKTAVFTLIVLFFLILLDIVVGAMGQFGGILIAILVIGAVVAVIGKSYHKSSQSDPKPAAAPAREPVKKAEKDEIARLPVDMED